MVKSRPRKTVRVIRNFTKSSALPSISELSNDLSMKLSGMFDGAFYRTQTADILETESDALLHYVSIGWREGLNPGPDFDTQYYLNSNPDVAAAEVCPLIHYVMHGRLEGRRCKPPSIIPESVSRPATQLDEPATQSSQAGENIVADAGHSERIAEMDPIVRAQMEMYFNNRLYIELYCGSLNGDTADPVAHYSSIGWRSGANPGPRFDTEYYLASNPDVAAADINPLYHFIVAGRDEGRKPAPTAPKEKELIRKAESAATKAVSWAGANSSTEINSEHLGHVLEIVISRHAKGVVISFSHDEYIRSTGGIQNCIGDEQQEFTARGWSYVHLSPCKPLPGLSPSRSAAGISFVITVNGERIGCANAQVLLQYVSRRVECDKARTLIVVHSLLGHSTEAICEFARNLDPEKFFFWIHDFSTLCSNYALLRNDAVFCGGPPLDSTSCKVCAYGRERNMHVQRVGNLFNETKPEVLFPSAAAEEFWSPRSLAFPIRSTKVLHHATLVETDLSLERKRSRYREFGIRVAFVGYKSHTKGWHVFQEIVEELSSDERFEFLYLGSEPAESALVRSVSVRVGKENRDAMVMALVENGVDVVINWSLCYETFSFSTLEAIASGALVLGRKGSGNVPVLISEYDGGEVLETKSDLVSALKQVASSAPYWRDRLPTRELVTGSLTARIVSDRSAQ